MAQSHHPHPGLHVVVAIHIYTKEKENWSEFYNGSKHVRTVLVEVPKHIPFESISAWVGHRHVSEGPIKWWYEFAMQQPEEAAKISNNGSLKVAVGVGKILSYVQADGSPYDVRPLHKDRASRILSGEVSERQSSKSKSVIDTVIEAKIKPSLYAKIKFKASLFDIHGVAQDTLESVIEMPILYSESNDIQQLHRLSRIYHFEDRMWDAVRKIDRRSVSDFFKSLHRKQQNGEYSFGNTKVEASLICFLDKSKRPIEANSIEFNRNKALEAMG